MTERRSRQDEPRPREVPFSELHPEPQKQPHAPADDTPATEPVARYQQAARILGEAAIRVAEWDGPIGAKKE